MMTIDHTALASLDLNLLVAFDALLAERNVTRAAARVGLGQSAMSHNLARLRALFDDELLTRAPDGMRPTPRAAALVEPVRQALSQIQALVARKADFDPKTAEHVFRIGLPDSMEVLLVPALLAHLASTAPGIRLRLQAIGDPWTILDDLDADRVDIVIGVGPVPEGRMHHKLRRLLTARFVCMYSAEHVQVGSPISLQDYVRLPHVLTSVRQGERGIVDDALAKLGLKRSIALITPRFLAVPFLVRAAPVITTMHARLALLFAQSLGLSLSVPPLDLPELLIWLLWHASYDHDPAHLWLRQTIARLAVESARATPATSDG
jgi:LysR family transcriptional activator of mexEF-oprN operon